MENVTLQQLQIQDVQAFYERLSALRAAKTAVCLQGEHLKNIDSAGAQLLYFAQNAFEKENIEFKLYLSDEARHQLQLLGVLEHLHVS